MTHVEHTDVGYEVIDDIDDHRIALFGSRIWAEAVWQATEHLRELESEEMKEDRIALANDTIRG